MLNVSLRVVGCLALLIGLVWIGQGFGAFPYPASSFMIGRSEWAYYGIGLAIAGAAAIGLSRRR